VLLDCSPDPPNGVGGETEAALRLESGKRSHQTKVALGDELGQRYAVAAKPPGDPDHETQVTAEQLLRSRSVLSVPPAAGKTLLFFDVEHRKLPGLLEVPL
jgi:hypothetical protein